MKRGAINLCVAVGLLGLVWYLADGAAAVRMLGGADPLLLAAAFCVLTLQTVISSLRWRLTAAQLGISINWATALREYYLSQIVNQTLPGGVIGDAGRAVRTRQTAGLMASGQAVVFERLAGQIALFAVMAAAFLVTWTRPGGVDWPDWAAWPLLCIMVACLCMPLLFQIFSHVLPPEAAHKLRCQGRALRHALAAPQVRLRQALLSLATVLCNIAAFGLCTWAVGVDLPIAAVFALVPLILFAMAIPATISGWGLREGAAAALFPIVGASASDGLAASVAFGLVFLATVLPGIVFLGFGTGLRPMKF